MLEYLDTSLEAGQQLLITVRVQIVAGGDLARINRRYYNQRREGAFRFSGLGMNLSFGT